MKKTLTIILSGMLLCGCSQKQPLSARPAIELVKAGRDISWHDGYLLHVARRDGTSIQGIRITGTAPDGQKTVLTCDTGTLSSGSFENMADDKSVRLDLKDATIEKHSEAGKTITTMEKMTVVLHE